MYYITKAKDQSLLTVDFTWVTVTMLRKRRNFDDLLVVRDNLERAQILSTWLAAVEGPVSPAAPKTLDKKYGFEFPDWLPDNYMAGIQAGTYPSCLLRRPSTKNESYLFANALKEKGLKGLLPELKILAISKPCHTTLGLFEGISFNDEMPEEAGLVDHSVPNEVVCEPVFEEDEDFSKEPVAEAEDLEVDEGLPLPVVFKHSEMAVQSQSEMISNIQRVLCDIDQTMESFPDLYEEKKQALRYVNGRIIDLEHIAELYDLNAADGYRLYRAIHDARVERRTIKNELAVLEKLEGFLEDIDMRKLGQINTCIENFSTQQYQTRTLTESDIKNIIHSQKTLSLISDFL